MTMDKHKNLAITAVATAPSPATTGVSLVVTAGHGTRFPATPFNATIWPTGVLPTPVNAEIVRVTNIATDTLTIARAQEGTTARTVVVGDQIAASITVKTITDIEDSLYSQRNITSNPYYADNTGATATTTIINQALTDADAAGGGIVTVPAGDYLQNGTINVPDTCILLGTGGRFGTRLFWTTDTGGGTYAIVTEAVGFNAERYPSIIGFEIDGPGNEGVAFGTSPANMHGVSLNSNGTIKECNIHGFKGGICFNGNHQVVRDCRSYSNYDGAYWDSLGNTYGDQDMQSSYFIGNKRAGWGIHGESFLDGINANACHLGFGPYCIYKENSGLYNQHILLDSVLTDCAFEAVGNGAIFDQGNAKEVSNNQFVGGAGGGGWWDAANKITADAADYYVVCANFNNNKIWNANAFREPGALGIFNCTNMANNVHYDGGGLIANLDALNKKFCADGNTCFGFYLHGARASRYRMMKYSGGAGTAAKNDLLYHGEFIAGISGCSKQGSDIPVGVTALAAADGKWVPICFEGEQDVNCSVGGGNANYYVIADLATRGKVQLSTLEHVGPIIGMAKGGTGGGTANCFLDLGAFGSSPVSSVYPWKFECRVATAAALPTVTYANGAAGVGATLTATANAALTVDGVAVAAGDRVLVKDQASAFQNGVYTVTNAGAVGAAFVLTRSLDVNDNIKMRDATIVAVALGTANKKTQWQMVSDNFLTIGTSAVRWTRTHPAYAATSASVSSSFGPFMPTNSILENMGRAETQLANQNALVSGTVRIFPLGVLRAGQTATAINFVCSTVGSGNPTNSWGGIARLSDRVVRGISASATGAGALPAANTVLTFTFGSTFTPDVDETLVGFIMFQNTTPPSFYGINQVNAILTNTPVIAGTSNTGATTPVANGATLTAFTADTEILYSYLT